MFFSGCKLYVFSLDAARRIYTYNIPTLTKSAPRIRVAPITALILEVNALQKKSLETKPLPLNHTNYIVHTQYVKKAIRVMRPLVKLSASKGTTPRRLNI